ncbi:acyl-phosphate glycerol 3-phosphate acyltransferase [delta proteobacterium NaphS2]|nr:acyl-phosphate glycerol 3-phosphate acyltransferase [delta proteobacterium NaphS2]
MLSQTLYFAFGAYVLGAVPFGKIIARIVAQIDITKQGSRNIGATNVARELGLKWGLLTLALDVSKGLVPVLVFSATYCKEGDIWGQIALAMVTLCPLLGHQFSVFMGFKGGKGVATALGVYLALSPISCLMGVLVFVLVVLKWDFISLGSMVSAGSIPIFLAFFQQPKPVVLASVILAVFIYLRHAENITRLVRGEERKWKQRKSEALG